MKILRSAFNVFLSIMMSRSSSLSDESLGISSQSKSHPSQNTWYIIIHLINHKINIESLSQTNWKESSDKHRSFQDTHTFWMNKHDYTDSHNRAKHILRPYKLAHSPLLHGTLLIAPSSTIVLLAKTADPSSCNDDASLSLRAMSHHKKDSQGIKHLLVAGVFFQYFILYSIVCELITIRFMQASVFLNVFYSHIVSSCCPPFRKDINNTNTLCKQTRTVYVIPGNTRRK